MLIDFTDDQHQLTINQIQDILKKQGFSITENELQSQMDALIDEGMNINSYIDDNMEITFCYPNEFRNIVLFAGGDYEKVVQAVREAGRNDLATSLIDLSEFSLYQKETIEETENMLLDFELNDTYEVQPNENSLAYHEALIKEYLYEYSNTDHPIDLTELSNLLKENINIQSWDPTLEDLYQNLNENPYITSTEYPYKGYFVNDNKRPLSYQNYSDIISILKNNETIDSTLLQRVERSLMPFYRIPSEKRKTIDFSDIIPEEDNRQTTRIFDELKLELMGNNGWLRDFDPHNKQQARRVISSPTRGDTYFTVLAQNLILQNDKTWENFFEEEMIAFSGEQSHTGEGEIFYLAEILDDIEKYNKAHTANYEKSANCARMNHFKNLLSIYQSRKSSIKLADVEQQGDFLVKDHRLLKYIGQDETIIIPDNITSIEKYAFKKTAAKHVSVPKTVTKCHAFSFADSNIKTISIETELLENDLFSNCTNLKEVEFLSPINRIPNKTFLNCTRLETVAVPDNCNPIIGKDAFRNTKIHQSNDETANQNLLTQKTTTIKNALYSRNQYLLYQFSKQPTEVEKSYVEEYETYKNNCKESVKEYVKETQIDDLHNWDNNTLIKHQAQLYCACMNAFNKDRGEKELTKNEQRQFYIDTVRSIKNGTILEQLQTLDNLDPIYNMQCLNPLHPNKDYGVIDSKTKRKVNFYTLQKAFEKQFKNTYQIEDYVIDPKGEIISYQGKLEGIISIPDKINCNNQEITITKVGDGAFYNAQESDSLYKITIPSTITKIGNGAFSNCKNLSDITFESPSNLEEIGNNAFENTGIKKITIPENTSILGKYLFYNCDNLEKVTMPIKFNYDSEKEKSILPKGTFFNCSNISELEYIEPFQTESLAFYGTNIHCDSKIKISKSKRTGTFIYSSLGKEVVLTSDEILKTTNEEFQKILHQKVSVFPSLKESTYKNIDVDPQKLVESEIMKARRTIENNSNCRGRK